MEILRGGVKTSKIWKAFVEIETIQGLKGFLLSFLLFDTKPIGDLKSVQIASDQVKLIERVTSLCSYLLEIFEEQTHLISVLSYTAHVRQTARD